MSINTTTTRKAGPFSGNGATVAFPFTWKVFQASDVLVTLTDSSGNETVQTLTTQYSVSLNANQDTNPGGTVTMVTAPATGYTLTLTSNVPQTQPTVLTNSGGFYPTVINDALDRGTILSQQLNEVLTRTLKLPVSVATSVSTTVPTPTANQMLGWNASANALTNIDASTLGTLVAYATARADTFTGTGAQTAFTLTANPGSLANLDVSIAGVTRVPGTDYTYSGTTLTFTSAPANGATILARYTQGLPVTYTTPVTGPFVMNAGTGVTLTVNGVSGQHGLRVNAGTASSVAQSWYDSTFIYSATITPTASGINLNASAIWNIQTGGSNRVVVNANGQVSINTPASGFALTVNAFGAAAAALFAGSLNQAGYISLQDGNTGNRQYSLGSGFGAIGQFGLYDNTAAVNRLTITSAGAWTFNTNATQNSFTINGGAATPEVAVTFSATAMTVDCTKSNVFRTTFTANVTTAPTISNPVDGQTINWFITQDATGSRTMTWPTSFKWAGATPGVLSTAANSVDLLVATYRSTTGFWYASLSKGFA